MHRLPEPMDIRHTHPHANAARLPGRALVLAGILLSAFNLRTAVTSITPLLDVLGAQFGFGATVAGLLGMVPTAAFALAGVGTPWLAHRSGLERTALLAMALAATGLLWRSLAGGTGGLLGGSVLALAGMGIGNVILPPLVKRYFPERIGPVSSLYITVLQAGTTASTARPPPAAATRSPAGELPMGTGSPNGRPECVPGPAAGEHRRELGQTASGGCHALAAGELPHEQRCFVHPRWGPAA